jgi:acyl-CoA synthetase (AMP-forming)/AMP-acid ligase II
MRGAYVLYPGWLEARLRQHPALRDVIVVPIPDTVMYQELCACVVPAAETEIPTEAELRAWAEGWFEIRFILAKGGSMCTLSGFINEHTNMKKKNMLARTHSHTCAFSLTRYKSNRANRHSLYLPQTKTLNFISLSGLFLTGKEDHMTAVPKYFLVFKDGFPTTPLGKTCRRTTKAQALARLGL